VISLVALMPAAPLVQRSLFLAVGLMYGILPLLCYLVVTIAAVRLFEGQTDGAYALGVTAVLLLLLEIRNAWDLTLFAIIRSKQE
jgi:hypothetical protein